MFCDYLLINDNKKYKKEYNSLRFTPKMNYFTRLIREMNVKYEGDNTTFLTREETTNEDHVSWIDDVYY